MTLINALLGQPIISVFVTPPSPDVAGTVSLTVLSQYSRLLRREDVFATPHLKLRAVARHQS